MGFASLAQSATWVCPQADGTQIYSDHVLSPGCEKVGELPTLNQSPPHTEASFTIEATPLALIFMGNTDGPSAGGLLTVGVIAALLNDPIDPTVCMTGTIQANLTIGPIGAVPQKMLGCKSIKATRMLIPYGQKDTAASRASVDTGIELIEVRTLAEAYELVTGRPLRKLTDN